MRFYDDPLSHVHHKQFLFAPADTKLLFHVSPSTVSIKLFEIKRSFVKPSTHPMMELVIEIAETILNLNKNMEKFDGGGLTFIFFSLFGFIYK